MTESDDDWNPKRPKVGEDMYDLVRELADGRMVVSSERVSWDKCLRIVLSEDWGRETKYQTLEELGYDPKTSLGSKTE